MARDELWLKAILAEPEQLEPLLLKHLQGTDITLRNDAQEIAELRRMKSGK